MRRLVWFRTDLRTRDHAALSAACEDPARGVVGLFIVSPEEWRRHDWAACKVDFVLRTVRMHSEELAKLNIPLLVRVAKRVAEIPGIVREVCREQECDQIHFTREYEVDESRRDEAVEKLLNKQAVRSFGHHDQTVLAPGEVRTQGDTPFTVFTPFKKRWMAVLAERGGVTLFPAVRRRREMVIKPNAVPERVEGFTSAVPATLWPAGERVARSRAKAFCAETITDYKAERDFPSLGSTSALSPYLAIGAISARQCVAAAAEVNGGKLDTGSQGATCWIGELVWREFYKHILVAFPRVCMHRAFKPATDRIRWSDNEEHFAAWCEGRTGVPIVDAAMRCLLATGWMHNRLRMVTAMYLTKDLFIDWRRGEKHFMRHLVDGDLSQNNGGWQWSASTGTDAAPYFRIFNPVSQSQRFDPRGEFIRAWVPELRHLSDEEIHDPSALVPLRRSSVDYPEPLADRSRARERVMDAFKSIAT